MTSYAFAPVTGDHRMSGAGLPIDVVDWVAHDASSTTVVGPVPSRAAETVKYRLRLVSPLSTSDHRDSCEPAGVVAWRVVDALPE